MGSAELDEVVVAVRRHAGVSGKEAISQLRAFVDPGDPLRGPGDDGAVVEIDGVRVVVCGEAIAPAFVRRDPYGAGVAAVLANVNDVAAMGGVPRAVVDTVVGPDADVHEVLRGLHDAAAMYDVPVVGGHTTRAEGDCSLSAFALGQVRSPLSMAAVRPGQSVLLAACLDGTMRTDFPFFTSISEQAPTLARDVRLLARLADSGAAVAAKDVSMAGALGSLAMLLEFTRHGTRVDLDLLPVPAGTDPLCWLVAFPTYAFWITTEAGRAGECVDLFERHGLACREVGQVDESTELRIASGDREAVLLDLAAEGVTGLWR
ncbi:methanogenesis marker 2 protein [Nocardioides hungaricus]